jgi:NAD(P)-dependent dehydrogenase (short-subunit alcohol dehydrogenase family)
MSGPSAAIVAGGTGALGRAVVRLLLERGSRVAVPWRRAEEWRALEKALGAPPSLFGVEADIADPASTLGFVEAAALRLGGLDGLAVTAGAWAGGSRFEEAPEGEWDRMMRANLATLRNVCRAALPRLAAGNGSIVAVGAQAAQTDGAGMAAYAVSKAAVHALVRVLALENRGRVRVNGVLPGTIDTPANRQAMPKADRSKWTSPEAIAQIVVFLLSSESAPVTGSLLPVDAPA